jgi:hypothetical protein
MKEIKTPKGVLKYRLPNIQEGYHYLSMVDKISTSQDHWKIKGRFIADMHSLVEWKELGYKTYDEFLNDKENNAEACSDIADDILSDVISLVKKKT